MLGEIRRPPPGPLTAASRALLASTTSFAALKFLDVPFGVFGLPGPGPADAGLRLPLGLLRLPNPPPPVLALSRRIPLSGVTGDPGMVTKCTLDAPRWSARSRRLTMIFCVDCAFPDSFFTIRVVLPRMLRPFLAARRGNVAKNALFDVFSLTSEAERERLPIWLPSWSSPRNILS